MAGAIVPAVNVADVPVIAAATAGAAVPAVNAALWPLTNRDIFDVFELAGSKKLHRGPVRPMGLGITPRVVTPIIGSGSVL
jgi:hypothetical protein